MGGRLSTVELIIRAVCFVIKKIVFILSKAADRNYLVQGGPFHSERLPCKTLCSFTDAVFLVMCDPSVNELGATYTHRDIFIDLSRSLTAHS